MAVIIVCFSQSSRFQLFSENQARWTMRRIIEKNNSLSTGRKLIIVWFNLLFASLLYHALQSAGFVLWLSLMLFPQASEPSLEWRKLFRWTHKAKGIRFTSKLLYPYQISWYLKAFGIITKIHSHRRQKILLSTTRSYLRLFEVFTNFFHT